MTTVPDIHVAAPSLFDDDAAMQRVLALLPEAIKDRRWFGAKTRTVSGIRIIDVLPLPALPSVQLLLVVMAYADETADTYLLPLREVDVVDDETSHLMDLAYANGVRGHLIDALHDAETSLALLSLIATGGEAIGWRGTMRGVPTAEYPEVRGTEPLVPALWRREGSNSSIAFGDRLMLKVFRRPNRGINPDWELGRYLTDDAHFAHAPRTAGAIEYTDDEGFSRTLGLLQELVPNDGDPRAHYMRELPRYFEAVLAGSWNADDFVVTRRDWELDGCAAPSLALQLFGPHLASARLLGVRTAEMHLALHAATDPDLAPIAFSTEYQEALFTATAAQIALVLDLLQRRKHLLPASAQQRADALLARGDAVFDGIERVRNHAVHGVRIRVHGDYHLEQVLESRNDFMILDFEGEPSKPLAERRITASPLKDVAGMVRSFDYAARPTLDTMPTPDDPVLRAACTYWTTWMSAAFLDGYTTTGAAVLLPEGREASELLLQNFLLEKAAYEVAYVLNNRPTWVEIPLRGIHDQLA